MLAEGTHWREPADCAGPPHAGFDPIDAPETRERVGFGLLPRHTEPEVLIDSLIDVETYLVFDPKAFRPSAEATAIPFEIDRFRNPFLKAQLSLTATEEVPANLILDTGGGYYSVVLVNRFIKMHDIATRAGNVVAQVSHTPNLRLAAARFNTLSVGPFRMAMPVSALLQTPSAGIIHDGVIGSGFFRRFTVTFDYTRKQMWLEPKGRLDERQPFDASGLEPVRAEKGGYVIQEIAPDSPAAGADLRKGDVLSRIDDRDTNGLTLGDLKALLSRSGTSCVLRIRRDGVERTVTLSLKERL